MNTYNLLYDLIKSLAVGGGFGYINYYILSSMNIVNITKENKEEKVFCLILFSIFNISLYTYISDLNLPIWINLFLVLCITIILSFTLFQWIIKKIRCLINKLRYHSNFGEIETRQVKTILFDRNETLFVYLYDLKSNDLLSHGCMGWFNIKGDNFEFEIVPMYDLPKLSFDEAVKKSEKNSDMSIYINTSECIKMVIIPEPKD